MSIDLKSVANQYNGHLRKNPELFKSNRIKFSDLHEKIYKLPDVGTDRFLVALKEGQPLATSNANPCFALCLEGAVKEEAQAKKGKTLRALAHTSHVYPIDSVLNSIKDEMEDRECIRDSIRTYVVGGINKDTIEEAVNILDVSKAHKIAEVCFRRIAPDEALDVLFTQHGIYATKSRMIEALDGKEAEGIELGEDNDFETGYQTDYITSSGEESCPSPLQKKRKHSLVSNQEITPINGVRVPSVKMELQERDDEGYSYSADDEIPPLKKLRC